MDKVLNLLPDHYYTLQTELSFFIGEGTYSKDSVRAEELKEDLLKADSVTICRHVNDPMRSANYYVLMTTRHLFFAHRSEWLNFQITSIADERRFQAQKKSLYNHGAFLIFATGGISVTLINQNSKYSSAKNPTNASGMNAFVMGELCKAIDAYFEEETQKREEHGGNFRSVFFAKQILQPIKDYTYYEFLAEEMETFGDNYIDYSFFRLVSGTAKRKVYDFYTDSFEPEGSPFQVGSRVAVESNESINDERKRTIRGVIEDIFDRVTKEDAVRIRVEFTEQFDHDILEEKHGHIYLQPNEVQKLVRDSVVHRLENWSVPAQYMYQVFTNFRGSGYEENPVGWEEYRKELLSRKYPPNPSQMEAIQKGISTKDIQLVLGPPGTGKTTVIVSWVEYFIQQGKRVLVSSQNNSAVDNVLERIGKNPKAKIIRIGSINKIQEKCKQYAPEFQVDEMAEKYGTKLEESRKKLQADIVLLQEMEPRIEEAKKRYLTLEQFERALEKHRMVLSDLGRRASDCHAELLGAKYRYTQNHEKKLHKEIYLFGIKRKNKFVQIIHFPVTKKAERELEAAKAAEESLIAKYIKSAEEYNFVANSLQKALENPQYRSLQEEMQNQRTICVAYSFPVQLQGPLSLDSLFLSDHIKAEEAYGELQKFQHRQRDLRSRLVYMNKALEDWGYSIRSNRTEILMKLLIQDSNVVGATCIGINSHKQFRDVDFDVSIIDECGQIQIHNIIVPMSRAPKALLLGDHLQIPPVANQKVEKLCHEDGINTDLLEMSFFEYLFKNMEEKSEEGNTPNLSRLDVQYRMPSNISDVISKYFYQGEYHAYYDMEHWKPIIKGTTTPLVLISTSNECGRDEDKSGGPGYSNDLEASRIADLTAKIYEGDENPDYTKVGIISAYGKQVRLIREKIKQKKLNLSNEQIYNMVASVDSFQGQERPLIIYSLTRSDCDNKSPSKARVGFMKELRRLNVAFTRCQRQLIVIGDFDYLTSCEYEELDSDNNPIPHRSEKEFSEFLRCMVVQAQSEQGEFYKLTDFCREVGIRCE